MQFSASALLVLASAASTLATDACLACRTSNNQDGCQRGVMGTGAHISVSMPARSADCSAAIAVTVTPQPVIVTVTKTNTEPAAVPTYVGDKCGGSGERYVSACKCAGVVAPTITAAAQTVTVTTTVAQSVRTVPNPVRFLRK
ncbi:hypothetical protein GGTG_08097 [Gaeumannomyces tritici R3-111a-1]|uniref:Uncharacterized protein n=1 Tax=Gaeumannomyces tritici (strain R3-111a-1) TaxID=644352 RepID=J3P3L1_GAET3|nr:hypothetical protein GGTG_08097 [Gaeumannomyces tritici R3-111a-1]EJT74254.1 hypothetical protein GGTG_08097 [Gaeumannomyces tritici R3-111a-1]